MLPLILLLSRDFQTESLPGGANICLLCWFDKSHNGASAVRHPPIRAIGVNLIALLFGFFQACRQNNAAAGGVSLHGVSERGRMRKAKNGLQHLDHVIECVLIVIQNDDVIELAQFVFC